MSPQIGDTYYRYEDIQYAAPVDEFERPIGTGELVVQVQKLTVVRVTPKGVRLINGKLVLNESRRKYACPSVPLALESFKARKRKQAEIFDARARRARMALEIARRLENSY